MLLETVIFLLAVCRECIYPPILFELAFSRLSFPSVLATSNYSWERRGLYTLLCQIPTLKGSGFRQACMEAKKKPNKDSGLFEGGLRGSAYEVLGK